MGTTNGTGLAAAAPRLEFEEASHTYTLEGRPIPSVTQILAETGFCDWLTRVPPTVLAKATHRGRAVHRAAQLYDERRLDYATVAPDLHGYLWAYELWIQESGFRPRLIEHRFHHPVYQYAGTLDREGVLGSDDEAVVDLKTGLMNRFRMSAAALQLAAYLHSLEKPLLRRRLALELRVDGSYRVYEYPQSDAARDFQIFLAAMSVANYQRAHGGRK